MQHSKWGISWGPYSFTGTKDNNLNSMCLPLQVRAIKCAQVRCCHKKVDLSLIWQIKWVIKVQVAEIFCFIVVYKWGA